MPAKKKSKAMRTGKGTVTAAARKRTGMKGKKGKYPIFDQKSCLSAIRLRHHGKGVAASAVLAKASRWASAHNNSACKAAVKRARAADRKRKAK